MTLSYSKPKAIEGRTLQLGKGPVKDQEYVNCHFTKCLSTQFVRCSFKNCTFGQLMYANFNACSLDHKTISNLQNNGTITSNSEEE